jgi:hypothetical protein
MDPIYYVISISLTIIMLAGVTYWLGRKFSGIDHKFEEMRGGDLQVKRRYFESFRWDEICYCNDKLPHVGLPQS